MDALARKARAGGVAPSTIGRRAPVAAVSASWPVARCRAAAAASAASAAASARRARPPRPVVASPATITTAPPSSSKPTTTTKQSSPSPSPSPSSQAHVSVDRLLRFFARHPPPRHLVLLAAAAPPALALAAAFFLLGPSGAASASEGAVSLSGAGLELFEAFLDQVTALGIWGPVAFCATVVLCEMIPLFPTQPLALSSGLLFGGKWGAVYQLIAVTLAATNAFFVARTVGRSLAERVIREELGGAAVSASATASAEEEGEGAEGRGGGERAGSGSSKPAVASVSAAAAAASAAAAPTTALGSGLARATRAIEEGGPFKQFTAVLLLRLTPVVPYSASNYLLGLTPLGVVPYLAGTVVGMLPWSVGYASLGGASRRLLQRGVSIDLLMADLSERAARVSGDAAGIVAALVAAAAAAYALSQAFSGEQRMASPAAEAGGGGGGGGGGVSGSSKAPAGAAAAAAAAETAAASAAASAAAAAESSRRR